MNCEQEQHNYENAIRKGRAHYVCPKCGKDITMTLVFMESKDHDWDHLTEQCKNCGLNAIQIGFLNLGRCIKPEKIKERWQKVHQEETEPSDIEKTGEDCVVNKLMD